MQDINECTIVGRLTREPEYRTPNNTPVINFTVANNRGTDSSGQQLDPYFIKCRAWRGTADAMKDNLKKGTYVLLHGHLYAESYTDKSGIKRSEAGIVVRDFRVIAQSNGKTASKASGDEAADNANQNEAGADAGPEPGASNPTE